MNTLSRSNRTSKEELLVDESIFSIANGFLGIRGTFTEGYGTLYDYNQTYLNGLFDYYDYTYEENLTGFPQQGQRFVNLIDGQRIRLTYQGNGIDLNSCTIKSLERLYNLESGYTKRNIHYQTKDEKYDFYIEETKFVSRYIEEVIGIELKVHSPNFSGEIKVQSFLQESNRKNRNTKDPRVQLSRNSMTIKSVDVDNDSIISSTNRSQFTVKSTMIHSVELIGTQEKNVLEKTGYFEIGKPLVIQKYIIHVSSLYSKNIEERTNEIRTILNTMSFEQLLIKQKEYYKIFAETSFVQSDAEEFTTLFNYNIYQLNNSGGESDIHNISAKGLSGEGYEGHYFWDTEIYMIPFFILTNPEKARNLLLYRYRTLEQSKREARNLGYTKGAKIPWRTINGNETSPYYPAGSAQFHINSDVAYAVIKYYEATNDIEFLANYGFELLIETARFLEEATNYYDGLYHLNSVTGPDEYTTVVDDNFYTNKLLKYHFEETVYLYENHREILNHIITRLKVTEQEMNQLKDIANHIYLPFDVNLNIFAQDKNFLSKAKLDLSLIPKEKFPLLLNYHPLYLYKHQVLKQADTMLALMLLDYNDIDILEDSFNYYEPITTHDSSLSKCIYSILAFKLKKNDIACSYFNEVLRTDYENTQNNTEHGLHVANLGGSYLGFVYGVLGVRIHRDYLQIEPHRTDEIKKYSVQLKYKNEIITISMNETLVVETTGKVKCKIYDQIIDLENKYEIAVP